MEQLAPSFRVLAPDLYGSGRSPDWSSTRKIQLNDEVRFLDPVIESAGSSVALVGHSYGAAVALLAAMAHPEKVRALALYEPTLFSLVDGEKPSPNDADGIRETVKDAIDFLDHGYADAAAEAFVDYWSGPGTWASMPTSRKGPIVAAIPNVGRWGHALLEEPTPLSAFSAIDIPVLLLVGSETRASARAVSRLLTATLPNVERVELPGVGHMGPVTHPEEVNQHIADFLEREVATSVTDGGWSNRAA